MEFYGSRQGSGEIRGGGAWVEKKGWGGEIINFASHDGHVHGFVQAGETMNIERIARRVGKTIDGAEFIDKVLIVWIAPRMGQSPTVVIGWYRNATVFRELKILSSVPKIYKENGLCGYYRFKTRISDAVLLPIDARTLEIPTSQKGYIGQHNIWYADSDKASLVVDQIKKLIKGKSRPPRSKIRKTDPEHNAKVERAAIRIVRKHFEKYGYTVESVESNNFGWDLEACLEGKPPLRIEVKGLFGSNPVVELTPNEHEKLQEKTDDYRLAIVTNATSSTPRLMICRFSGECQEWMVEMEGEVERRMDIQPRISARIRIVSALA